MTTTYYKAVRPDGTDFYTGTVRWLPEDGIIPPEGWLVTHPTADRIGPRANAYLSVATVPTDCTGAKWPCRLLRVERAGRQVRISAPGDLPHKRASVAWLVREELPAHLMLGPQGDEVAAIIGRARRLTASEIRALTVAPNVVRGAAQEAARSGAWSGARSVARRTAWDAAMDATWDATWDASRDAARDAAGDTTWTAAWAAAWYAVRSAAWATLTRDLISAEHHDTLMGPWRSVIKN